MSLEKVTEEIMNCVTKEKRLANGMRLLDVKDDSLNIKVGGKEGYTNGTYHVMVTSNAPHASVVRFVINMIHCLQNKEDIMPGWLENMHTGSITLKFGSIPGVRNGTYQISIVKI